VLGGNNRICTQEQLREFPCGCKFSHAILAGEYNGVCDPVPDEGKLEVANRFFLAEDVFQRH
jgi:hypothetical protein